MNINPKKDSLSNKPALSNNHRLLNSRPLDRNNR
jgi:hypothetical protein